MDYSKVFIKVNEREWKGQTANFDLDVKRNGHCGYWITFTNRTTGVKSTPRYGKHFKALASWIAKFEDTASATIEYSNCSKSQVELETECPDFHNLPCAWMDTIEATQEEWEKAA